MGFGDNEPPAVRADPFPATLTSGNHFNILILTFVNWDVIKLDWSINGGQGGRKEIPSGMTSTDFVFSPVKSGITYSFSATGCNKAADGSTNFCSPSSNPIQVAVAVNTNSFKQFLQLSGINTHNEVSLRTIVTATQPQVSLRSLMGLEI